MTNVNDRAAELFALYNSKKKVEAFLIVEDFPAKDIASALKELGVSKRMTFANCFYDWLAEERRTKEEAEKFVLGAGDYVDTSANAKNHLSHYLNIWELSDRVWGKVEGAAKPTRKRASKVA